MDQSQQHTHEQHLRQQALLRQAVYTHPPIKIHHEPINAKQSLQLQHQLKGLVVEKVDQVRRNHDLIMDMEKYEQIYAKNFQTNVRNQIQDIQICKDIQQMHNIADILLHPPNFTTDRDLYLYRREMPDYLERQQNQRIFKAYQEDYQKGLEVDDFSAQDAIKRAKRFLLKQYDQ